MSPKHLPLKIQALTDWLRRYALEGESIAHELDILADTAAGTSEHKTQAWMLRGYAYNIRNFANNLSASLKLKDVLHLEN